MGLDYVLHIHDGEFELAAGGEKPCHDLGWRRLVGGDGKLALAEAGQVEMRGIADRAPGHDALTRFRRIGEASDHHRYLVVMVEIVGCKTGQRIDIRRSQAVRIRKRGLGHREIAFAKQPKRAFRGFTRA